MLAALDNNFNVGREQKRTIMKKKSGLGMVVKHHFRIAYRKPNKKIIARKFYAKKSYDYLKDMMKESKKRAHLGIVNQDPTKRKVMAPIERAPRKELIENSVKFARFK